MRAVCILRAILIISAADWARRRKKDKVARRDRSNGGSALVDPLTGAVAAKPGHESSSNGQEKKHVDSHAPSGGNRQRKTKAAASKFGNKLIETRQELQNSMQRVTTTAAQWDRVAAELDAKALSIGQVGALILETTTDGPCLSPSVLFTEFGHCNRSSHAPTMFSVDIIFLPFIPFHLNLFLLSCSSQFPSVHFIRYYCYCPRPKLQGGRCYSGHPSSLGRIGRVPPRGDGHAS